MTEQKEDEFTLDAFDDLDIPDKEIEYQEDDGSNDCEDGACKI